MEIARLKAKPIMAGFSSAVVLCGILLFAGCGGGNQTDGELVKPTEEVEKSRAAMQNQLKQNPNMYGPTKGQRQEKRR